MGFYTYFTNDQKDFMRTFIPAYEKVSKMKSVKARKNQKGISKNMEIRKLMTVIKDDISKRFGVDWDQERLPNFPNDGLGGTPGDRNDAIREVSNPRVDVGALRLIYNSSSGFVSGSIITLERIIPAAAESVR
jgi:hypothetical protein